MTKLYEKGATIRGHKFFFFKKYSFLAIFWTFFSSIFSLHYPTQNDIVSNRKDLPSSLYIQWTSVFIFHNYLFSFFPRAHTRVRTGSLAITRSVKNSLTQMTRNPGRWSGRIITRLRTCTKALSGCPTMTRNPYVLSRISLINRDWPGSWLGRLIPMTSVENAVVQLTPCCGPSTMPFMKKKTDITVRRRPVLGPRWFLCKSWRRCYSCVLQESEDDDHYYLYMILWLFSDKIFKRR